MAVRDSMADLIARTRTLIADPNATSFTDQQVQDALDETRQDLVRARMGRPVDTGLLPDKTYYYSPLPNLESSVYIFRNAEEMASGTVINGTADGDVADFNLIDGSFIINGDGLDRYITVRSYNLRTAGRNLLTALLGQLRSEYDVAVGSLKAQRSQQIAAIEAQIRSIGRVAGLTVAKSYRSDVR
jgi:hypothetical protein